MIQGSKLKLMYVVTQAEWGGAQRYVLDLALALKNEFDVIVAAGESSSEELLNRCAAEGIRTHIFKNLVREINPVKDITAIFELARFFKQEKPNIIHLNSSKAGLLGALALRRIRNKESGIRGIYTVHGWVFNEPLSWLRKKLYILMERIACAIHDKIIVLSEHDFNVAVKNRICDQKKLAIIHHGIEPIDFFPREVARIKLATSYKLQATSSLWVVTIANLYKTKGIEYLIAATNLLKKDGSEPNFVVIGDGPERKNHELLITDYGLRNFNSVGSIPDAARYLKAFDIFVLPSVKEGMPYALLEAMQAGLPIIGTRVGAVSEIIENAKSGLIVTPKNSNALAKAIGSLVASNGLREALGNNAADHSSRYTINRMIEQTKNLYKKNSS